jgi:hypothetical protein
MELPNRKFKLGDKVKYKASVIEYEVTDFKIDTLAMLQQALTDSSAALSLRELVRIKSIIGNELTLEVKEEELELVKKYDGR